MEPSIEPGQPDGETPPLVGLVPLDDAWLWQSLPDALDDEEAWAALNDGRRNALAPAVATIAPEQFDTLCRAVAALDRALRPAAPPVPAAGVLGYDFHLTPTGPRLIEINTNPGGLLLALAQARACRPRLPGLQPAGPPPEDGEILAARAFLGPCRRIAIVDDQPARQFLYPEFLLYRRLFRRLGASAAILDGETLDEAALARLDGVYNRLTDFALTAPCHAPLAAAWRQGRLRLTPDCTAHAVYSDKRRLAGLCADPAVTGWIPRTVAASPDLWETLWRDRRNLFFKPALGYAGKGAYRGDKISRTTWDSLRPEDYVAQATVPPPVVAGGLKVDIRLFAVDGIPLAAAARLYRGQTTNFRSAGGGLAAVFIDPG